MFKEVYENKCNIPDGVYFNPETNNIEDVMFIHLIDEDTLDIKYWKDLIYQPINIKGLAKNKTFPTLHRTDWTLGSIYKDCYVTPNNLHFTVNGNIIEVKYQNLETLSLKEYINTAHNIFLEKIKNIYETNDNVVVLFSGGVDSLLVLSYIYKLDMLHKTTILYNENFCVEHPSLIRNSPTMLSKLHDIKKRLNNQLNNFVECEVNINNLIDAYNTGETTYANCYSSWHMLNQLSNCAVITGNFGNQVTFHSDSWLDHLMFCSSDKVEAQKKFQNLLSDNKLYMNNHLEFDFNDNYIHYNRFTFNRAYFNEFDGVNNIKFYTPFAEAKNLCRQIKTSDLTFEIILDAQVPRELIKRNVGNLFERNIYKRSEWDNDSITENLSNMLFDRDKINPVLLTIPTNLTVDDEKFFDKIKKFLKLKKISYQYYYAAVHLNHISKIHKKYGRIT